MENDFASPPDRPAPGNALLAALPDGDRERIALACDTVKLATGQVLQETGTRMTHAYFPQGTVLSLTVGTPGQGDNLEVALVGREGMVGLPLLLGGALSDARVTVTSAGVALRIAAEALQEQVLASPRWAALLHRYLLVALAQLSQSAVCTRHHRLDQRLARWLLMAGDRVREGGLEATHESLASRLGVRRAGITRAANILQQHQLIAYRRGMLTLVDRRGLEEVACACYAVDKASYRTLMEEAATP